ncbi:MAG: hypothetical protein V2B18_08170 [Pseudomonadota bacterium]
MNQTIIRQKLSNYAALIYGGQPLFGHPAVTDFAEKSRGFDCFLPRGRIEKGDRTLPSEVLWEVNGEGSLLAFKDLGDVEQVRVREKVENALGLLRTEGKKLAKDQSKAMRDLGQILEKIQVPTDDFIYVLDGKPIITGWGLVEQGPEPQMIMTNAAVPAAAAVPAGAMAAVPGKPDVDSPQEPAGFDLIMDLPGSGPGSGAKPPSPLKDGMAPPPAQPPTPWWKWAVPAVLLLLLCAALLAYFLYYKDAADKKKEAKIIEEPRVVKPLPPPDLKKTEPAAKTGHVVVEEKSTVAGPSTVGKVRVWDEGKSDYVWIPGTGRHWDEGTVVWDQTRNVHVLRDPMRPPTVIHDPRVRGQKPVIHIEEPPRSKIEVDEKNVARVFDLKVVPADAAARWEIRVDPSAPGEVVRNPNGFIQFLNPHSGLEAIGSQVRIGVLSLKEFKAEVTVNHSSGGRSVHFICSNCPGR